MTEAVDAWLAKQAARSVGGQIDLLGSLDVGGSRHELDAYDTPPWAPRALIHYLGDQLFGNVWEPCAGAGLMSTELAKAKLVTDVVATDVEPRASGVELLDYFAPEATEIYADWHVTNPPYTIRNGSSVITAADFVRRALVLAGVGCAFYLRIGWLEPAEERFDIFESCAPTDYLVLPRCHFLGAPPQNNQTSVWFIWRKEMIGKSSSTTVYSPAFCRQFGRKTR